jgi:hypothetical protein
VTQLGAINDLVRARLARRDPDPDCALAQRALALSGHAPESVTPEAHYQRALLGACRVASGDDDGLPAIHTALSVLRTAYGPDDHYTRIVEQLLAGASR